MLRERRLGKIASVCIDFRHDSGLTRSREDKHAKLRHPLLIDMAVHHFDLLRMLLGADPQEMECRAWNPPGSAYCEPPAA